VIVAIDFDGTVVEQEPYSHVGPLVLRAGAREGLAALKRAGHVLLLWSARSNRALQHLPELDPLVRAGAAAPASTTYADRVLAKARQRAMVEFVARELPGVFDAVDDGRQGKPLADLFLDDRAVRIGHGPTAMSWGEVARIYGQPAYGAIKGR